MAFETDIETQDGRHFHLYIKSLNSGGYDHKPKSICLFISISVKKGAKKGQVCSLDLRFDLLSRTYKPLEKLEGINETLYDTIIEKLESTRGKLWGRVN